MREDRHLPNLIIIGAMKCATTSLHYYLDLHPRIFMSKKKELDFFIREYNWRRGVAWYQSNFTGKAGVCGESSPNYTKYPFFKGVPERMHAVVPDAKLIYVVRDPVERIVSHYVHSRAAGDETRDMAEALADPDTNLYISCSKYYMQLAHYLRYFPKSGILIVSAEELMNNRGEALKNIFRFLNVDDSFHSPRFLCTWHKSRYKRQRTRLGLHLDRSPVMKMIRTLPFEMRGTVEKLFQMPFSRKVRRPVLTERLRAKLAGFLKEDTDQLREYTGCDFKDWRI